MTTRGLADHARTIAWTPHSAGEIARFARVSPAHSRALTDALIERGEVASMALGVRSGVMDDAALLEAICTTPGAERAKAVILHLATSRAAPRIAPEMQDAVIASGRVALAITLASCGAAHDTGVLRRFVAREGSAEDIEMFDEATRYAAQASRESAEDDEVEFIMSQE